MTSCSRNGVKEWMKLENVILRWILCEKAFPTSSKLSNAERIVGMRFLSSACVGRGRHIWHGCGTCGDSFSSIYKMLKRNLHKTHILWVLDLQCWFSHTLNSNNSDFSQNYRLLTVKSWFIWCVSHSHWEFSLQTLDKELVCDLRSESDTWLSRLFLYQSFRSGARGPF